MTRGKRARKPATLVAVFDANVIIPLSLPSGQSRSTALLSRLKAAGHVVAISQELLDEVADKMRTKPTLCKWLGLSDAEIEQFLQDLPALLGRRLKRKLRKIPRIVAADPDDDMVLATAVTAKAAYIVTEDSHLLELGEHRGIKIMSRDAFAAELDQLGVP